MKSPDGWEEMKALYLAGKMEALMVRIEVEC
jgi:hypothetical protein